MLREQRNLTQAQLAKMTAKHQTAISRIEDPDYGQMSLQTLLELAAAFDCGLSVRFVPVAALLNETRDQSQAVMRVSSFSAEQFRAPLITLGSGQVGNAMKTSFADRRSTPEATLILRSNVRNSATIGFSHAN